MLLLIRLGLKLDLIDHEGASQVRARRLPIELPTGTPSNPTNRSRLVRLVLALDDQGELSLLLLLLLLLRFIVH